MALTLISCGADELPVEDLCDASDAAHDSQCIACSVDADCVIGGNPCCQDKHRWLCYHKKLDQDEKVPTCDATCDLAPPKPKDNRCACVDGTCQGR